MAAGASVSTGGDAAAFDARPCGAGSAVDAEETSRPPIILLHGFGQHGASWDEVAGLLRGRGYEVVAPDLLALCSPFDPSDPDPGFVGPSDPDPAASRPADSGPRLICPAASDPSDPDPVARSLDGVCRGVAALVRDVFRRSGSRPALVGYSMGGRIALETALRAARAGASSASAPLPLAR